MRAAIAAATTADEVRQILFTTPMAEEALLIDVALYARAFDDALLLTLLTRADVIGSLWLNPHLPPTSDARIAEWALNRLRCELKADLLWASVNALVTLARAGRLSGNGPVVQTLMALALGNGHRRSTKLTHRRRGAIEVLLAHPDTPGDVLVQLHSIVANDHDLACQAILHPNAPPTLWDGLRTIRLQDKYVSEILKHERIRHIPSLRSLLVAYLLNGHSTAWYAPGFAQTLCVDANPADCAQLFRALVLWTPALAGAVLRDAGEKVMPYLTQEDIRPLLHAPERETRLAAICALGLAHTEDDLNTNEPERQISMHARHGRS